MSVNPYAPPKAVVTDPDAPSGSAEPPNEARLAARLLWCAIALSIVELTLGMNLASSSIEVVAGPLLVIGVLSLLTHQISRGRNWARIVLLVLVALGMPGYFLTLPAMLAQSAFVTAISVAESVLQIAALYLVFIGAGASWFRRGIGG